MWQLWGIEILVFPLTWHIAYTTACCYRTGRDTGWPQKILNLFLSDHCQISTKFDNLWHTDSQDDRIV